jgi:hypothetical protein
VKRLGKCLTFSNVVACIALFVALGGSVYAAAKINGKQIRKSSLPGNRLKAKTVNASRIKPKSLTGRQIKPKSLTGTEIDQTTLTDVSAVALAGLHYEAVTVPLSREGFDVTGTANCPADTYVVGGGATMSHETGRVKDSGPAPFRTGWEATGYAWYSNATTMTVTAICVRVREPRASANTAGGVVTNPPPPSYDPVP